MSYPDYIAPSSLDEALELLGDPARKACVLAGGTNLIPRLRTREIESNLFVDICRLPLNKISLYKNYLHLGAGVTCSQVMHNELAVRHLPALVIACREIEGPSIRNRSTLGGNLAASFPEANTVPAFLIYNALVCMAKGKTERTVPISSFFQDSGKSILEPGELIKEILIPFPPPRTAATFLKFGFRRGMSTAVVNVAVSICIDQDSQIRAARIALGAFARNPFRALTAENMLVGTKPGELATESLARLVVESYPARDDLFVGTEYRKKLAMILIGRGLKDVYTVLAGIDCHD